MIQSSFKAAVIGAGPAGVAVVGKLLDSRVTPIIWIDEKFEGGRLALYSSVPSNTKVKLFCQYGQFFDSFRQVWTNHHVDYKSLAVLDNLNHNDGCRLEHAADLVKDLTNGLRSNKDVQSVKDKVLDLEWDGSSWRIGLEKLNDILLADKVILSTGSHPRVLQNYDPEKKISLDQVLNPTQHSLFHPTDTIALFGSSHSAMLALKRLVDLPDHCRPRRIVNFYKSPLKFAEYLEDGRIKHDNTGLKGEVAVWAREHISDVKEDEEDEQLGRSLQMGGLLERIRLGDCPAEQKKICDVELPKCTKIVSAIGYERINLPTIAYNGRLIKEKLSYTDNGQLIDQATGETIPGLFGVGIAFPERVKDVDGSPELAVGMWKFIRYIDRIF